MIKFKHTEVVGWEAAIRGMRNPMNSWDKSDSTICELGSGNGCYTCKARPRDGESVCTGGISGQFAIGSNDLDLMKRLVKAGVDRRKFMEMIVVYVDITAPLYWWKEFDTYKVGTVANSCSTMHKIAAKEFELEDFSFEHLYGFNNHDVEVTEKSFSTTPMGFMSCLVLGLNQCREQYLKTGDKDDWWQMIQLLPSSYNQKRTVMMSYEVLANIYKSRKNHTQDEWCEHEPDIPAINVTTSEEMMRGEFHKSKPFVKEPGFCDWIKTLPYSELITGEDK